MTPWCSATCSLLYRHLEFSDGCSSRDHEFWRPGTKVSMLTHHSVRTSARDVADLREPHTGLDRGLGRDVAATRISKQDEPIQHNHSITASKYLTCSFMAPPPPRTKLSLPIKLGLSAGFLTGLTLYNAVRRNKARAEIDKAGGQKPPSSNIKPPFWSSSILPVNMTVDHTFQVRWPLILPPLSWRIKFEER